jgi:hypothetical protein
MERANYPLACLLPSDSVYFLDATSKRLRSLVDNQIDEYAQALDGILNRQIRYYSSINAPDSIFLSFSEVGNRFNFEYYPYFKFFHERDARNLWLNEVISDATEISEDEENRAAMLSNYAEDLLPKLVCNGYTYPNLSIRNIGVIDSIDVGNGLFAEEPIPACTLLGEYTGVIATSNFSSSSDDFAYCCEYPSCDGGTMINATEIGNLIRFINHSPSPNSRFLQWNYDGMIHILCVSRCIIAYFLHILIVDVQITTNPVGKNEQITVNYGASYWSNKSYQNKPMP